MINMLRAFTQSPVGTAFTIFVHSMMRTTVPFTHSTQSGRNHTYDLQSQSKAKILSKIPEPMKFNLFGFDKANTIRSVLQYTMAYRKVCT